MEELAQDYIKTLGFARIKTGLVEQFEFSSQNCILLKLPRRFWSWFK